MSIGSRPRGTLLALGLIIAGTLLFLDNLGIVPVQNLGAYWPLSLVLYGLGMLYYRRTANVLVWSGTLIVAGTLLVLGNLGLVRANAGDLWPLLLIAGGVLMLINRATWDERARTRWAQWRQWESQHTREDWKSAARERLEKRFGTPSFTGGGRINEIAIFSSMKRRVEVQDFRRGELVAVMGSIEIDFSCAQMQLLPSPESGAVPVRRALLNATAVFGSIEIVVPRNWRIVKDGAGVFGSYEDKTVPARNDPGVEPATLVLRGGAVFGSVEIRN